MHCQVLYHHDQKCPVVMARNAKRARQAGLAPAKAAGAADPSSPVPATARQSASGAGQGMEVTELPGGGLRLTPRKQDA